MAAHGRFLNAKAHALQPHGIRVGYHNHNLEFVPLGQTSGMQILLEGTDPGLVTFEMDTGGLATARADPYRLLAAHGSRFTQMHVKDIQRSAKLNYGFGQETIDVGRGVIDWRRLLPAAYRAGIRRFFIEQEASSDRAPLKHLRASYAFLAWLDAS